MKVLLGTIVLSIYLLFLVLNNRSKTAVKIMIFMIPFTYFPIQSFYPDSRIFIQASGFLVFFVWLGFTIKKFESAKPIPSWTELSPKLPYLYYFLASGIILGLIYANDVVEYSNHISVSSFISILSNSTNLLLAIMLLKILSQYQYDVKYLAQLGKLFSFTILIQVTSQLLKILGLENILWNLLRADGIFDVEDVRNVGMFSGFGVGPYLLLVLAFSFMYYKRYKILSIATIMGVFIFATLTGARQNIIFIVLMLINMALFFTWKRSISKTMFISVMAFILMGSLTWDSILSKSVVARRFSQASLAAEEGDFFKVMNRSSEVELYYVFEILRESPLLGKGLMNLGVTSDCPFFIVGHVMWYNIYRKFGIIGFVYLLLMIMLPAIKIFIVIRNTEDKAVIKEGTYFLSILIAIFGEQFLGNFFWFTNTIMLYAFIYFLVFSFINRQSASYSKIKVI
jgi:hypothetical protein